MNKFVSEKELEENRKRREEEWEKVRKPEDPKEMPEEPYDPRSLFDRLQEQKDKKQQDFEDSIKFKNQFRGVNKDEASFLDQVAIQAAELEKKKNQDIKKELEDFRKARAEQVVEPIKSETTKSVDVQKSGSKRKSTQSALLMKAVKRKREPISSSAKNEADATETENENDEQVDNSPVESVTVIYPPVQKCVGLLPGIGSYSDDSDSNSLVLSSDDSSSE